MAPTTALETKPTGQTGHTDASDTFDAVPGAHGSHEEPPAVAVGGGYEYAPAAHAEHERDAREDAIVPAAQAVCGGGGCVSELQGRHPAARAHARVHADAPAPLVVVPSGQGKHAVAPAGAYDASGHAAHAVAPGAALNVPDAHAAGGGGG